MEYFGIQCDWEAYICTTQELVVSKGSTERYCVYSSQGSNILMAVVYVVVDVVLSRVVLSSGAKTKFNIQHVCPKTLSDGKIVRVIT